VGRVLEGSLATAAHERSYAASGLGAVKVLKHTHLGEQPNGKASQAVTTALVTRESSSIDQQDVTIATGEMISRRSPSRASANDNHLGLHLNTSH
jgi:hypothetical protein